MMNKKFHIEPENIDEMTCSDWFRFLETNDAEPFKRFLPEDPKEYYAKGNPDYAKQLCVEAAIQQGKTTSEIEKECDVNSKDIEEYIEINRIIEELDDIEAAARTQIITLEGGEAKTVAFAGNVISFDPGPNGNNKSRKYVFMFVNTFIGYVDKAKANILNPRE